LLNARPVEVGSEKPRHVLDVVAQPAVVRADRSRAEIARTPCLALAALERDASVGPVEIGAVDRADRRRSA
jgi:hypothetical protein